MRGRAAACGPSFTPQAEQTWRCWARTGRSCRSTGRTVSPCTPASRTNADQPGVVHGLGHAGSGRARLTHRSSAYTAWLSRMMRRGGLVVEVPAGIGHPRVDAGDLDPRLVPVTAALWPCGTGTCCSLPQLPLRAAQEPGDADLAVPSDRTAKRRQAQVDAQPPAPASGAERSSCRVGLHDEAGEVPAGRVLDHGDRWPARRAGRRDQRTAHVPDLRQAQPPARRGS